MNQRRLCRMIGIAAVCLAAAMPASALTLRCPRDSVKVGDVCIDKYEASVWQIPAGEHGARQTSSVGPRDPRGPDERRGDPGESCIHAVAPTLPGDVRRDGKLDEPAVRGLGGGRAADELCDLVPGGAGVRALRKAACSRTRSGSARRPARPIPVRTTAGQTVTSAVSPDRWTSGSRAKCTSNWGAFDMVGNVEEWVADWVRAIDRVPRVGRVQRRPHVPRGREHHGDGSGRVGSRWVLQRRLRKVPECSPWMLPGQPCSV